MIDLSEKKLMLIDLDEVRDADVVITMGCGAEGFCPTVRKNGDEIERKVLKLIEEFIQPQFYIWSCQALSPRIDQ